LAGTVLVACHPKALAFGSHEKDHSVPAPSEVVWTTEAELLPTTRATTHQLNPFRELLVDDGNILSAASVAAHAGGGRVLVGAVFSPHLLDCALQGLMVSKARTYKHAPPKEIDEDEL
jgi:hypothetical protein